MSEFCIDCKTEKVPLAPRNHLLNTGWTDADGAGKWVCPECNPASTSYNKNRPATTTIDKHEGKKYLRQIQSALPIETLKLDIDVYCVIEAFKITCPAQQHALKKILCAGERGKGTKQHDFTGAIAALNRAIELENGRGNSSKASG